MALVNYENCFLWVSPLPEVIVLYLSIFSFEFISGEAVAMFKHHTAPITSVEWHPTDSSVFAASGSDNQVTLWDLAVERDDITEDKGRHLDVPPQLLFIHMVWG